MINNKEEFDTNLSDPNARKKARRNRVIARETQLNQQNGNGEIFENSNKKHSRSEKQIIDSRSLIDKKKARAIDTVTEIRVGADFRENIRRINEENQKQERLERVQKESIQSGKINTSIELKWAELLDHTIPQKLHDDITKQRELCKNIINNKNEIINDFQVYLKMKDEEYVKSLKQQSDDIDELILRMRNEYTELRDEYEEELKTIEKIFEEERDDLLEANKNEIDLLFEKRRTMELMYMEKKQKLEEDNQKELEDLRTRDGEEYAKLKIKLETDIQTMKQQLEEMRATYQLNTEKLEYNYRVLTERDIENNEELSRQKKRLNKYKDILSTLMTKFKEMDKKEKRKNDELTEEYRRITRQFKDLQVKFRHFEVADQQTYENVWNMHEEEMQDEIEKLLRADKLLQEQILHWKWREPDLNTIEDDIYINKRTSTSKESNNNNTEKLDLTDRSDNNNNNNNNDNDNNNNNNEDDDSIEDDDESNENENNIKIPGEKLQAVIQLLVQEAGFLIDHDLRSAVESMPQEEAELAQAESLLRSLGVTSETDMQELMNYFFYEEEKKNDEDDDDDDDFDFNKNDNDDNIPEAMKQLSNLIEADDVIQAIEAYIRDKQSGLLLGVKGAAAAAAAAAANNKKNNKNYQSNVQNQHNAALLAVSAEYGIEVESEEDLNLLYWIKLGNIIPDDTYEVWVELENSLQDYNDLLVKRSNLVNKVDHYRRRNLELRSLLNQYLGSDENQNLIVPPNQTMRVPVTNKTSYK